MQLLVWPWRSRVVNLGACVTAIIFFSWWSFELISSWQDPVLADQTGQTFCIGYENVTDSERNCAPGPSQSSVAMESPFDQEKPEFSRYRSENLAPSDSAAMASVRGAGEQAGGQPDLYIDPYDPSTWPGQSAENIEVEPIAPLDPYDPATWPGRETPDLDIQPVEPIDLFDATTWPASTQSGNKVTEAISRQAVDVYDDSTWPQDNAPAEAADFKNPIDPYDPETWPDES